MGEGPWNATERSDEYIGILALDVRNFSGHNSSQQKTIVTELQNILRRACERGGLEQLLQDHEFLAPRGDGCFIGFSRKLLAAVVDRFFDALQAELRTCAPGLRAEGIEIRLRASADLGPVESFNALLADSPSGAVMVNSARMVDARAVRRLLDASDAEATYVAAVLSPSVMNDVVAAGRTARRPSEFVEARLDVAGKDYAKTGFLRVPAPSGELLRSGLVVEQTETELEPESVAEQGASVSNSASGPTDEVFQARDVHGGVHDRSVREVSGGVVVTGNNSSGAGRDHVHQDFSGTFRTKGDANFGPFSGRRALADDDQADR